MAIRRPIPALTAPGARVKLVAGSLTLDGVTTQGPIAGLSTEPLYADVALDADQVEVGEVVGGGPGVAQLDGLVRRGILDRAAEGRFGKGENWALAVRRYCATDRHLAEVA